MPDPPCFREGWYLSDGLGSQMGEEECAELIPDVEIFKEVMVELIKNREIDLTVLTKERSEYIQDSTEDFQLNDMLLKLADAEAEAGRKRIRRIHVSRIEDGNTVVFSGSRTKRERDGRSDAPMCGFGCSERNKSYGI